jgi:hypothetical protein
LVTFCYQIKEFVVLRIYNDTTDAHQSQFHMSETGEKARLWRAFPVYFTASANKSCNVKMSKETDKLSDKKGVGLIVFNGVHQSPDFNDHSVFEIST